jgi:hypothetical protein
MVLVRACCIPKLHSERYGVRYPGVMLRGDNDAEHPVCVPVTQGGRTLVFGTENGVASEIVLTVFVAFTLAAEV